VELCADTFKVLQNCVDTYFKVYHTKFHFWDVPTTHWEKQTTQI